MSFRLTYLAWLLQLPLAAPHLMDQPASPLDDRILPPIHARLRESCKKESHIEVTFTLPKVISELSWSALSDELDSR